MAANIDIISTLVAERGVDALISTEPVLACMDKGYGKVYQDGTYQSGDTIFIRREDQPQMPAQSNVIQLDPIVQREIPATVLIYNDGVQMGSVEQMYNLGGNDMVDKRIIKPRMKNMAVQAAVLCYNELATASNFFGTPGTDLTTSATFGAGAAILLDQLANGDLYAMVSNQTMNAAAGSLAAAFNPSTASATAYFKGRIKEVANLNVFATSNIPNHANGSAVGNGTSGMVVSVNVTTGATSISVSGGTANGVITKNSLIWFTARRAVQPNTKKVLGTLRYFTVAATVTLSAGGAGVITVTEAIYGPENNKLENISALPVITTDFVGIVGTASHTYEQAIVMQKDAAAFIGLPLPEMYALKNSKADYEGVQIAACAFGDGTNRINMIRWDILCVAKIRQYLHVGRTFTRDVT